MIDTACVICKKRTLYTPLYAQNFSLEDLDTYVFSARKSPEGLHYRMVRCNGCGLVFANPILNPDEILKLYEQSQFTDDPDLENAKTTYSSYFKQVEKLLKQKEALLEIGCSNGFFLEKAKEKGFLNVYGIEPNQEAVQHASPEIRENLYIGTLKERLFAEKWENMFDVICAFHVFDHLPDPNEFLRICHTYLKNDGYLFFIHHDVQYFWSRLLKQRCPIIDVVHTHLYDKKTQTKILQKNRFEIEKIFNIWDTYSLKYWIKLLPLPPTLKTSLSEMTKKLFLESKKLKLPIGNMGVIAKKSTP